MLLDVSGAFDNVSHEQLLHDLRARRIGGRLVQWVAGFLSGRLTRIFVDGFESPLYSDSTGISHINRKVTSTLSALYLFGKSVWGARMLEMRKLYRGVAISQMMYACSIWSQSRAVGTSYKQQTLHTLEALQARAARAICGAYKTTSVIALDVETLLLPMERQIEKQNMNATLKILASTNTTEVRSEEANTVTRKHISPFCNIRRSTASQATAKLDTLKYILPSVSQPCRVELKIYIDRAKDVCSRHDAEAAKQKSTYVYTDKSASEGHVGPTAVRLLGGTTESA